MNPDRVILVLEDNAADQYLIEKELQSKLCNPINSFSSAKSTIHYLEGKGIYSDRGSHPFPLLLLLDLRLADESGFEMLDWCKTHPNLQIRSLPIAVITHLNEIGVANRAYSMGADTFFTKPLKFDEFENWITQFSRLKLTPRPPQKLLVEVSTS